MSFSRLIRRLTTRQLRRVPTSRRLLTKSNHGIFFKTQRMFSTRLRYGLNNHRSSFKRFNKPLQLCNKLFATSKRTAFVARDFKALNGPYNGISIFLSGDGHNAFQWYDVAPQTLQAHLQERMRQGKLIAHVETYPDEKPQVYAAAIDANDLKPLAAANKVNGFELSIFKPLAEITNHYHNWIDPTERYTKKELDTATHFIDKHMLRVKAILHTVKNNAPVKDALTEYCRFAEHWRQLYKKDANVFTQNQAGFITWVSDTFIRQAGYIRLRDMVNSELAGNMNRVIAQNEDCTHIIAIGDAHLKVADNVQRHITIPGGTTGVMDDRNKFD